MLSRLLDQRGIKHEVLNAKQHFREAEIVAQAGRLHAVTVATNMAGRGVDILLGGNPEGLAQPRRARRGPRSRFRRGQGALRRVAADVTRTQCKADGAEGAWSSAGCSCSVPSATRAGASTTSCAAVPGRQGEPGESRFYLSMEDELIRIFATGAVQWLMSKALPDDEPIDMKMISKAVERAQNTVEQRNAEIRKDVLKYDEVLNEQRKVIYKRRMQVHRRRRPARRDASRSSTSAMERPSTSTARPTTPRTGTSRACCAPSPTYYPTQVHRRGAAAGRDEGATRSRASSPKATAYYEAAREAGRRDFGHDDVWREVEREVMLQIIDARWREHLSEMDYLRDGINLRAMGQKDPLVEWQREGYEMFGQMMGAINNDYLRYVMHVDVAPQEIAQPEVELPGAELRRARGQPPAGRRRDRRGRQGLRRRRSVRRHRAQGAGDGVAPRTSPHRSSRSCAAMQEDRPQRPLLVRPGRSQALHSTLSMAERVRRAKRRRVRRRPASRIGAEVGDCRPPTPPAGAARPVPRLPRRAELL